MADAIEVLKEPLVFCQKEIFSSEVFLYKTKDISILYMSRVETYLVLKKSLSYTFGQVYVKTQRLQIKVGEMRFLYTKVG